MRSKSLMLVFVLIATTIAARDAAAQPSDAQVKKDLKSPGVKTITLTRKTGTKQWNADTKTWEYVRGAEVKRGSELPGVDLLIVGDAVYQSYGAKWRYWKFRVIENRYDGIPNPTPAEILALVGKDLSQLVGSSTYDQTVGEIREIALAADPAWTWHTPNSVSFQLTATYDTIISYTEIESRTEVFEVRLYRDDLKAPWKDRYLSSSRKRTSLGKRTLPAEEIRRLPTLGQIEAERRAQAARAALPAVAVPEFASAVELVQFTHAQLRTGSPAQLEAYLLQVLSPFYFVEGSTTRLDQRGVELIAAAKRAYEGAGTYALEYCKDPSVDRGRTTATRFYLLGVVDKVVTVIAVEQSGGRFEEGVKVGQKWTIAELQVGVRKDQEAIDFIRSFSDRKKLCPGD